MVKRLFFDRVKIGGYYCAIAVCQHSTVADSAAEATTFLPFAYLTTVRAKLAGDKVIAGLVISCFSHCFRIAATKLSVNRAKEKGCHICSGSLFKSVNSEFAVGHNFVKGLQSEGLGNIIQGFFAADKQYATGNQNVVNVLSHAFFALL